MTGVDHCFCKYLELSRAVGRRTSRFCISVESVQRATTRLGASRAAQRGPSNDIATNGLFLSLGATFILRLRVGQHLAATDGSLFISARTRSLCSVQTGSTFTQATAWAVLEQGSAFARRWGHFGRSISRKLLQGPQRNRELFRLCPPSKCVRPKRFGPIPSTRDPASELAALPQPRSHQALRGRWATLLAVALALLVSTGP